MAPQMTEEELIRQWRTRGDRRARAELAEQMLPLVKRIAGGYCGRGVELEDLVQVGSIGLLKAIDRFDPDRGVRLSTYAHPNIAGEIKRHFRDFGWAVRMPRELQELSARVRVESERLQLEAGRRPLTRELADALFESPRRIEEAIQATKAYTASSLEVQPGDGLVRALRAPEKSFEVADDRIAVMGRVQRLPERERRIIYMRFFEDRTQEDIAGRVGVSQMQVSRLLRSSLEAMSARRDGEIPVG
jgi:RNA polymerase sigma-B factor